MQILRCTPTRPRQRAGVSGWHGEQSPLPHGRGSDSCVRSLTVHGPSDVSSRLGLMQYNSALAFGDDADLVKRFLQLLEKRCNLFQIARGNHQNHAEAHVEAAPHVRVGYVADLTQEIVER